MNAGGYPDFPMADAPGYDPARLLDAWVPDDPYQPEEGTARYYGTKAHIAAAIRPTRVVEIGVRAGYSALAFHMGHPYAEFYGLDMDEGGWGGVHGYLQKARERLSRLPISLVLEKGDSQVVKVLPKAARNADLFHVDGDHTPKGCAHDIILALKNGARYVVVDDYDLSEHVTEAVYWAVNTLKLEAWYAGDGGYRGNAVLARKEAA